MLTITPATGFLASLINPLIKKGDDTEQVPEPLTQVANSSFITTDFDALKFSAADPRHSPSSVVSGK